MSVVERASLESSLYSEIGASSAKAGVLKAAGERSLARYFATPLPDFAGDANAMAFLHADGAGTKSILAYLAYREGAPASVFRGIAYDSLAMNLDDVACAGCTESFVVSNTIGRNRRLISDEIVREIILGYQECAEVLIREGCKIAFAGGETADMGDLVRTVVVDSTVAARGPRSELVDTWRITPGDIILGFSSTGRTTFESVDNSGIGSNGISLARHATLKNSYTQKYPEIVDPQLAADKSYFGKWLLSDKPEILSTTIQDALLSPTRSYTPLIRALLSTFGPEIHGLIHCTGGGQTKIKRFGKGVRYHKNSLFPIPPIFSLIQESGGVPWNEMYSVFNMGHRLEACVKESLVEQVVSLAAQFGIAAKVIGQVTSSNTQDVNELVISSEFGEFSYS